MEQILICRCQLKVWLTTVLLKQQILINYVECTLAGAAICNSDSILSTNFLVEIYCN